jgi:hypothetical protein
VFLFLHSYSNDILNTKTVHVLINVYTCEFSLLLFANSSSSSSSNPDINKRGGSIVLKEYIHNSERHLKNKLREGKPY